MTLITEVNKYRSLMQSLCQEYLDEELAAGTYFGIFDNSSLQAFGVVKCLHGHWFLRQCVVKPEYRGRGLQRQLIRERLEHIQDKTNTAKITALPDNVHSIDNILACGFSFEKKKKIADGSLVHQYRLDF